MGAVSVSVMVGSIDRLRHEEEVKAGAEVEVEVRGEGSKDDVRGVATVQAAEPSSASDRANTVDTACLVHTACTADVSSLSFTGLLERWYESALCWVDGVYRISSPNTARTMEASSKDRSLKGLERFMCSLCNNQLVKQMNQNKNIEVESKRATK